jgi:hypothetical protein
MRHPGLRQAHHFGGVTLRQAGLPRQPMPQRPHPVTLPRPGLQGFGGQGDELGVQHVEMPAHRPQPLFDVVDAACRDLTIEICDGAHAHPVIVSHTPFERNTCVRECVGSAHLGSANVGII